MVSFGFLQVNAVKNCPCYAVCYVVGDSSESNINATAAFCFEFINKLIVFGILHLQQLTCISVLQELDLHVLTVSG